jgi:hypothetical protein
MSQHPQAQLRDEEVGGAPTKLAIDCLAAIFARMEFNPWMNPPVSRAPVKASDGRSL